MENENYPPANYAKINWQQFWQWKHRADAAELKQLALAYSCVLVLPVTTYREDAFRVARAAFRRSIPIRSGCPQG